MEIKEKEKLSYAKVAKRFGMSPTTVFKWSKRLKPKKKRNKLATKIDMKGLMKDVEENPELYQYERAKKFEVSKSSIGYALKRLGVTYKKKRKDIRKQTQESVLSFRKESRNMKKRGVR